MNPPSGSITWRPAYSKRHLASLNNMVPSRDTLDRLVPEVVFGVLWGTLNNFLFWMDCGHLFLITWWFEQQFWYHLPTLCRCITRKVKHYNMMSCEDLGLISFRFCLEALLAHSVINVNGGRPKTVLVRLRFTCPWRAAEGRPCRWKTDCCTFVFSRPVAHGIPSLIRYCCVCDWITGVPPSSDLPQT